MTYCKVRHHYRSPMAVTNSNRNIWWRLAVIVMDISEMNHKKTPSSSSFLHHFTIEKGLINPITLQRYSNRFMYRRDRWCRSIDILIVYGSDGWWKTMPHQKTMTPPTLTLEYRVTASICIEFYLKKFQIAVEYSDRVFDSLKFTTEIFLLFYWMLFCKFNDFSMWHRFCHHN